MTFKEYRYLVLSDVYRITGTTKISRMIIVYFSGGAYQYVFWLRTCRFLQQHWLFKFILYPFARFKLRLCKLKYGVTLSHTTEIGSGLYLGAYGHIAIHGKSKIGRNCTIAPKVSFSQSNRGKHKGWPVIGDNVLIGAGAMLIGGVNIGNNAAIGAGSIVTRDVPDNAVVVGNPCRIISYDGSEGYINRIDYDKFISPHKH